ncbi:hypothetical protein BOTBODRAFT_444258 [Botryobasidium botryosum FD-172 SS1]|uniref:DUF6532 domain-containing protein n=1 Tax=Botryobasidium botryosum (strain FD-172 SS1) TaxID=930990 RepID=A0A067N755_BOTB1|nr:hypothetical protein BOTBODRAFT_444258 [Botryobasidium botryosum FD-172 SS1]
MPPKKDKESTPKTATVTRKRNPSSEEASQASTKKARNEAPPKNKKPRKMLPPTDAEIEDEFGDDMLISPVKATQDIQAEPIAQTDQVTTRGQKSKANSVKNSRLEPITHVAEDTLDSDRDSQRADLSDDYDEEDPADLDLELEIPQNIVAEKRPNKPVASRKGKVTPPIAVNKEPNNENAATKAKRKPSAKAEKAKAERPLYRQATHAEGSDKSSEPDNEMESEPDDGLVDPATFEGLTIHDVPTDKPAPAILVYPPSKGKWSLGAQHPVIREILSDSFRPVYVKYLANNGFPEAGERVRLIRGVLRYIASNFGLVAEKILNKIISSNEFAADLCYLPEARVSTFRSKVKTKAQQLVTAHFQIGRTHKDTRAVVAVLLREHNYILPSPRGCPRSAPDRIRAHSGRILFTTHILQAIN